MVEPLFIVEALPRQFASGVDLKQWVRQQQGAAKGIGCTFFRVSNDLESVGHVLVEAWLKEPDSLPPIGWPKHLGNIQSASEVSHG